MLKITVTGPECSGKSTLCKLISEALDIPWVPEYAPEYLSVKLGQTDENDILNIMNGQQARWNKISAADSFIADTDLSNLVLWSRYRMGRVSSILLDAWRKSEWDICLLMYPDLVWEPAPFRENPHDRLMLFWAYREWMDAVQIPYCIVEGTGDERLEKALKAIAKIR
jgi:nicotinamide riboside kinase